MRRGQISVFAAGHHVEWLGWDGCLSRRQGTPGRNFEIRDSFVKQLALTRRQLLALAVALVLTLVAVGAAGSGVLEIALLFLCVLASTLLLVASRRGGTSRHLTEDFTARSQHEGREE